MQLDMSDALRPGELFALRWKCLQGDRLELRETVYRGKIRPFGKTKNSMRPVAFIFPNARGGFIVLKVVAEELGLPKLTFQVIRRSVSTWNLQDRMGTLTDVQCMLRHTRAETTADVYAQIIPDGVQRTVEAIDARLTGNSVVEG